MSGVRNNSRILTSLLAVLALSLALGFSAPAFASGAGNEIMGLGSISEFEQYNAGSDEYKFTVEPAEDGSVVINVEPGAEQILKVSDGGGPRVPE